MKGTNFTQLILNYECEHEHRRCWPNLWSVSPRVANLAAWLMWITQDVNNLKGLKALLFKRLLLFCKTRISICLVLMELKLVLYNVILFKVLLGSLAGGNRQAVQLWWTRSLDSHWCCSHIHSLFGPCWRISLYLIYVFFNLLKILFVIIVIKEIKCCLPPTQFIIETLKLMHYIKFCYLPGNTKHLLLNKCYH